MSVKIRRITNANVYADGGNLLGMCEDATLPDLKMKLSEWKALGMVGSVELFSGVEKLECKIKWNSFHPEVAQKFYNPQKAIQLQFRMNVESHDSTGLSAEKGLIIFVSARIKNVQLGNLKQHDNIERESNFTVTAVKEIYDGQTTLEYDALANIYRVNGVNILDQYKLNTGS